MGSKASLWSLLDIAWKQAQTLTNGVRAKYTVMGKQGEFVCAVDTVGGAVVIQAPKVRKVIGNLGTSGVLRDPRRANGF